MIAICDHNSAGNTAATLTAGRRAGLAVVAGMEITTAEEVHVVGLFPDPAAAEAASTEIGATLPDADDAYYARFGPQRRMDADGQITGTEPKMLAGAAMLDLSAAVQLIHRYNGVAIAAHVNRPSFSVLSQLGLFPDDACFDAIEVFVPCDPARPTGATAVWAAQELTKLGLPVVSSSDAHFLGDIGRCQTRCDMEAPTFDELTLALRGVGGRGVRCA